MKEKIFRNSPKGRLEIPNNSGSYSLLDRFGEEIYNDYSENIKERIKEHHYDKTKHFSYIKIKREE